MAQNSKIEWTDHTFNPVRGCEKISPGCANCYAAREAIRFPNIRGIWGCSGTRIVAVPDAWKQPLRWNREAERRRVRELHSVAPGVPHHFKRPRVFCASLADVFEDWKGDLRFPAALAPKGWVTARWNGTQLVREFDETPMPDGWRKATMADMRTELFQLIEATPNLDWQLLTKRPENVMRMVPEHWREKFPDNVWMGTTVEDQQRADERIPILLKIPAKVRFLSCEPLLGPVDLHSKIQKQQSPIVNPLADIHQVIIGGESGSKARPMHPDWARSLRDQCLAAGVPVFFKQWGEYLPHSQVALNSDGSSAALTLSKSYLIINQEHFYYVGKDKAGRLLDGREWNEMPALVLPLPNHEYAPINH